MRVLALGDEINNDILNSQIQILKDVKEINFVEAEIVNRFWIKLNCKNSEIEDGKWFILQYDELKTYDGPSDLSMFCTATPSGFFNWLIKRKIFKAYYYGEESMVTIDASGCREFFEFYKTPEKYLNALDYILERNMTEDEISGYLNDINKDMNAYIMFNSLFYYTYDVQIQYVLRKTDGTFLATNILKLEIAGEEISSQGFGSENTLNFIQRDSYGRPLHTGTGFVIDSEFYSGTMSENETDDDAFDCESATSHNIEPNLIAWENTDSLIFSERGGEKEGSVTVNTVEPNQGSNTRKGGYKGIFIGLLVFIAIGAVWCIILFVKYKRKNAQFEKF